MLTFPAIARGPGSRRDGRAVPGDPEDAADPACRRGSRLASAYATLRSQYVLKALDYLVTADVGASDGQMAHAADAGSRSHKRARRAIQSFRAVLPDLTGCMRRRLLDPSALPFAFRPVSVLGFGSTATVFLLPAASDGGGARVLKVYRRSLGSPLPMLLQQARARQSTHDRASAWYGGSGVVVPAHHLVLRGPLLRVPAVACVQRCLTGMQVDPFRDVSEPQLIALLRAQPGLASQFRLFAERTLEAADTEGACVDIVGPGNLVIVAEPDGPRLLLIDVGVYEFERKRERSPRAFEVLLRRLALLRRMTREVPP